VRPRDRELAGQLDARLLAFDREKRPLPGIRDSAKREAFLEQLLESIRRVKFVEVIRGRQLSDRRADPNDELFDPLKAAILHQRQGDIEEAYWLVFLFVHFGKHARAGWRYAREVYGRLGEGGRWDWASTSADPPGFRAWLHAHQDDLKREGVPRGFGNHRKYESLDAYSPNGTGATVESYVRWVNPPRTHEDLIEQACQQADGDPRNAFHNLYQSMDPVARFGRTARFDYLTMVGKLSFAPIEPGSTYMQDSTGPFRGARLLLGEHASATDLDAWLVELDGQLNVGMQVLEDALCNWQKSPDKFKPFRG
jgi:alpha-glutamyl/putrescinyl thymine pyrophosphorylase-like protein